MDKSLTPLIAVIALVILLTVIVINSDFGEQKNPQKPDDRSPKVQLRPNAPAPFPSRRNMKKRSDNTQLLNIGEAIGHAKTLLSNGKIDEAEDTLKTLLVFDPENMQALSLLGGILYYSNRYKEAEVIFRKQIQIDPRNHLAYNHLGSVLAKQKKFKEAIDNASIALGMSPDSGEAHINLSGMYAVVGDKKKAIEHFRKAYDLLGYAILPLSYDEAFNNIRDDKDFQDIISKARNAAVQHSKEKKLTEKDTEKNAPLFNSGTQ